MRQKGILRGAVAQRAVTAKKHGRELSTERNGCRMLTREFVERYLAMLDDVLDPSVSAVRASLHFILGDKDALSARVMTPYREAAHKARRA
jgi:hypothetical protein